MHGNMNVKYFNSMVRTGPIQPLLYMNFQLGVIVYIKRSIESIDIIWHRPIPIVQNIYFTRFFDTITGQCYVGVRIVD
jgi:hypothetical protein